MIASSLAPRRGAPAIAACAMLVACFSALLAPSSAQAEKVVIGTGSTAGVYYQVARAICRLVNRETATHGLSCEAVPTDGSLFNLRALRSGELQLGLAQSDWQFHATMGSGPFEAEGADADLRALFSVHGEPFTLVARRDAGILSLDDLRGHRVNLGNPGSGQRATMEVVMAAKGWSLGDFALAEQLGASEQSLALCHNRVQALVYTVGHPNPSVAKAVGLCDAILVEVSGPEVDRLVAENSYYAYTTVPGGIYDGNAEPVRTFGVKATVLSSTRVSEEAVHAMVSAVFDNLDEFRAMHPALGTLSAQSMVSDGLSAPLHDGALRYYREKGLQ